jgi:hypothetical protein
MGRVSLAIHTLSIKLVIFDKLCQGKSILNGPETYGATGEEGVSVLLPAF